MRAVMPSSFFVVPDVAAAIALEQARGKAGQAAEYHNQAYQAGGEQQGVQDGRVVEEEPEVTHDCPSPSESAPDRQHRDLAVPRAGLL